jgi:hypothetical protein
MIQDLRDHDLELLSQYLDGELGASESRALEIRLRAEQELGTALLRLSQLDHRLRDAFALGDAVPPAVTALLEEPWADSLATENASASPGSARVLAFPGATVAPSRPANQPTWMFAAAASVALALGLGLMTQMGKTPDSALPGSDRLVSAALDTQLSGDGWTRLDDGRELQTVLSFPHEDGGWCREFLLRGGDSDWRAVACRDADRWVTKAAGLESYLESTDAYRPAGASDSEDVAVFISQHAADIALGHEEEQAMIASGWSPRP